MKVIKEAMKALNIDEKMFQPKAVLLFRNDGVTFSGEVGSAAYGGLFYPSHPLTSNSDTCAEVVSNGFRVYNAGLIRTNGSSYIYHYLALR